MNEKFLLDWLRIAHWVQRAVEYPPPSVKKKGKLPIYLSGDSKVIGLSNALIMLFSSSAGEHADFVNHLIYEGIKETKKRNKKFYKDMLARRRQLDKTKNPQKKLQKKLRTNSDRRRTK